MTLRSDESKVLLAIKALQKDPNLSLRAVARIYNVPRMTLVRRRAGQPSRRDTLPNLRKLTESEEQAIV